MEKNIERFALLFVLAAVVALSWMKPLDAIAEKQVDAGFNRALISFAVARTLNGVISVAQGTEISIAPGGLGANLTPGQILDPVNDLVEQFSELMLLASVAFGVMKVLLTIGSYWVFPAMLTAVALAWGGLKFSGRAPPLLLTKILLVLIFVRFSVPIVAVGSDYLYKQFLDERFKQSQMALEKGKDQLLTLEPHNVAGPVTNVQPVTVVSTPSQMPVETSSPPAPSKSLWEKAKETALQVTDAAAQAKDVVVSIPQRVEQKIEQVQQRYDPRPYIEKLKSLASQLVESVIDLIVVFVLQTIIIPLGLLWVLYRLCLALIESEGRRSGAKAA